MNKACIVTYQAHSQKKPRASVGHMSMAVIDFIYSYKNYASLFSWKDVTRCQNIQKHEHEGQELKRHWEVCIWKVKEG